MFEATEKTKISDIEFVAAHAVDSETDVIALVSFEDTAETDVIAYLGDVTNESDTTACDAALVSEMLHDPNGDFTYLMRFEADVYGTYTEGGAYVTVSDAALVLYRSVGLEYNA